MLDTTEGSAAGAERKATLNVYRGLLWREWLAQRNLVITSLAVWLACGWVLLLFYHPGFIIAFGVIYALLAGPRLGGADAAEGSEEFAFALPPTRAERYLARLALGGSTVLLFTVLGVVTIALDMPQTVWGLFVNSGFTEPFPACQERFLYPLAVAIPFAVFAFSFALAATAGTRGMVGMAWFLGGVLAGAAVGLAFLGEWALWGEINGYISVLALFALAPLALLAGYLRYVVKEGVSRPAAARGASLAWVVVVVVAVFLLLGVWPVFKGVSRSGAPSRMEPTSKIDAGPTSESDTGGPATLIKPTAPRESKTEEDHPARRKEPAREVPRHSEEPKLDSAAPEPKPSVPEAEKGNR